MAGFGKEEPRIEGGGGGDVLTNLDVFMTIPNDSLAGVGCASWGIVVCLGSLGPATRKDVAPVLSVDLDRDRIAFCCTSGGDDGRRWR
jgi:hypothetical protein